MERVSKQDYYLAQISAMIVAVNSKDPTSIKVQDFIIKAAKPKDKKPMTKEERTARAKAFWLPMLQQKGKKSKKQPKR